MRRKKFLALFLVISMLSGALVGCASNDSSEASATKTKETETESTSEAEESIVESEEPLAEGVIYPDEAKVYWAIPSGEVPRVHQFDVPLVTKYLEQYAPNIELTLMDAESNADTQLQQIEGAISAGCDFMIYQPALEESAAGALQLLNSAGIPFCSMVRTPFGGDCPLFVTMPFDVIAEQYIKYMETEILTKDIGRPYKVALLWMISGSNFYQVLTKTYHETLDQWVEEGKIEIVFEGDSVSYLPSDMKTLTEQMLTQCQNEVDICITMNDEVGTGVVAALEEQGITQDVYLLGGCDSTAEGIARTMKGWQAGDVLPDYDTMADAVATTVATYLATGEYPLELVNGTTDNNYMEDGIPTVLVDPILVTKDTVQKEIFDKGILSKEDVEAIAETLR